MSEDWEDKYKRLAWVHNETRAKMIQYKNLVDDQKLGLYVETLFEKETEIRIKNEAIAELDRKIKELHARHDNLVKSYDTDLNGMYLSDYKHITQAGKFPLDEKEDALEKIAWLLERHKRVGAPRASVKKLTELLKIVRSFQ